MSKEAVAEFRVAVNANEDWHEDIQKMFFNNGSMQIVSYAKSKGYEFTDEEYTDFVENDCGELSEFETELVAGGMGGKTG